MTAAAATRDSTTLPHISRMFGLLRDYRGRWLLATAALLAGSAVQLALPQALRLAVDDAVAVADRDALDALVLLALAAFTLLGGLTVLRHVLMSWLGHRVVADLRQRTFRHLLRQPPGYFHAHKSGELVSRLTSDIEMLQYAVGAEFSIALRAGLTVLGGLALLLMLDPLLTLVMLATGPPLSLGAVWVGRQIRHRSREVQDVIAAASSRLKEAVVGIETVQVFTAEPREADRYGAKVVRAFQIAVDVALARGVFMGLVQVLGYGAVSLIVWIGARRIMDGVMTAGELSAFLLYTLMVTAGLVTLAQMWSNLQRAIGATGRVFELLDEAPDIHDAPDAAPLVAPRGEIVFDRVSFAYPTRPDVQVLTDVTLNIASGEKIALVGRSGAGKSTIAALLHRFHDPTGGSVRVDGHDLRALRLEDLRGAIATVHQEPMLFSGTIADNIAYGAPGATRDGVAAAAGDAYIADFIEGLPDGYDTEVGERGVRLSGGQRQRIAIARATLADPRILVLDEATSHLDTANEALVHAALARLMEGRTTLIIAHRLSTVQDADRILVLDGGRVAEEGRHEALLDADGVYRELVHSQALPA